MGKVKGRKKIENVHCGSGSRILGGLFREFGMTRAAHVALVGQGIAHGRTFRKLEQPMPL